MCRTVTFSISHHMWFRRLRLLPRLILIIIFREFQSKQVTTLTRIIYLIDLRNSRLTGHRHHTLVITLCQRSWRRTAFELKFTPHAFEPPAANRMAECTLWTDYTRGLAASSDLVFPLELTAMRQPHHFPSHGPRPPGWTPKPRHTNY